LLPILTLGSTLFDAGCFSNHLALVKRVLSVTSSFFCRGIYGPYVGFFCCSRFSESTSCRIYSSVYGGANWYPRFLASESSPLLFGVPEHRSLWHGLVPSFLRSAPLSVFTVSQRPFPFCAARSRLLPSLCSAGLSPQRFSFIRLCTLVSFPKPVPRSL